jgi:hypothetical protein
MVYMPSPFFDIYFMIFLIRVFTYLNCVDCRRHLDTLEEYCMRTPAQLEVIDVDREENLPLAFQHKIEGIPHTLCYDIRGNVLHSFFGVKTVDQFADIIYGAVSN